MTRYAENHVASPFDGSREPSGWIADPVGRPGGGAGWPTVGAARPGAGPVRATRRVAGLLRRRLRPRLVPVTP